MKRSHLLVVDSVINLGLGMLLIVFPETIVNWLGVPHPEKPFYANILGAIFVGIGIALMLESRSGKREIVGLGLGGAVIINLCGGFALTLWLLFGGLSLTTEGVILLWALVIVLVGLSSFELIIGLRKTRG